MPSRYGMSFFCRNCLPARVTGKILLPTINGEAAARGGRVLFKDTDLRRSAQIDYDLFRTFKGQLILLDVLRDQFGS